MHSTSRNRLSLFFSQFTRTRFTLIFVHIKALINVLSEPKDQAVPIGTRPRLIHALLMWHMYLVSSRNRLGLFISQFTRRLFLW